MDIRKQIHRRPIGVGWTRVVFLHKTNPDWVIKIAHRHLDGNHNRMEWEIWQNAPRHIKRWLVPCISVHRNYMYLVTLKGEVVDAAPDNFPFKQWVTDWAKLGNWVKVGNRILLADYGMDKFHEYVLSIRR